MITAFKQLLDLLIYKYFWFGLFANKFQKLDKHTEAEKQKYKPCSWKKIKKPHGADKNISPQKRKEGKKTSSPAETQVKLSQKQNSAKN